MYFSLMGYEEDDFLFLKRSKPVAKKEHRCCECGKTIKRAERYILFKGKFKKPLVKDSYFKNFKTCFSCNILYRDYL
ncbi:MAG: hypothetical protein HQK79_22965 [Desulfobacterales bacterium]|nr:hypothetical protein [Desulfobacterales bacterium]